MFRNFIHDTQGSVATTFAALSPVIIGAMVMLVEVGHWRYKQTELQKYADMAAIAGAREITLTQDDSRANAAAIGDAADNGFDFTRGRAAVTTNITSGPYAGQRGVIVELTHESPLYLSKYFFKDRRDGIAQAASATALISSGGDVPCVLALAQPDDQYQGIYVSGSSAVTMGGCVMYSNAKSAGSITVGGRGAVSVDCLSTAGGLNADTKNYTLTECDKALTFQKTVTDPYERLVMPPEASDPSCTYPTVVSKSLVQLKPGRYCSTIVTTGRVELTEPGNYVFDREDLILKSSGASLVGDDVTLFFMNDARPIMSGAQIELKAPEAGDYKGIAIFGDKTTNSTGLWLSFEANGSSSIEGAIYFPNWNLKYAGGNSISSQCTSIIAKTVTFIGNSELTALGCRNFGIPRVGGDYRVAIYQ